MFEYNSNTPRHTWAVFAEAPLTYLHVQIGVYAR